MLSNLGWQDLETRRKITDLTMFFKIKTGNVRISFPNDLRFVRTVPSWNALSPVSVRADSVAVFHSSICNNVMF